MSDLADLASLRGLLSLLPGDESAAQRGVAALALVANLRGLQALALRGALRALRRVESYSRSLERYPLVKQAFWEQLLASELMAGAATPIRQELRLQEPRFPRLVLDFSRSKASSELLQVLADFFADADPREETLQSPFSGVREEKKLQATRFVSVTLRLSRCRLTAETITLLRTVLLPRDVQVADDAVQGVKYCVTSLDLSENAMGAAELTALAGLLNECRWRRDDRAPKLEELVLEKVVGRALTTESWAAFRAFVGAAFGIVPSLGHVRAPLQGEEISLKRLSLANNSFSYHHTACICSALRYEGASLEELSLAHSFSVVDPTDRETCWQWLAIGLRSKPSRDGCSGLRRLDLSGNPLYPRDSEVWRGCLRDPKATILNWAGDDVEPQERPSQAVAPYCLLPANIELHPLPNDASPRLRIIEKEVATVAETKQWEVLGSVKGEPTWVCIVVPGFGVAWTHTTSVIFRGQVTDTYSFAVSSELVMNDMTAALTSAEALESFVVGFGGQLQALELRHNTFAASDLNAIIANFEHLRSLDVEGCRLLNLQLLVDALNGQLGQHLRELNINGNLVGADAASILAAALRGEAEGRIPVLRELRMAHNEIGASGVQLVHALLEANKNLQLLELDLPKEGVVAPREAPQQLHVDDFVQLYRTRCMRLDVAFQNELLGVSPLLVDRKYAFLLVLSAREVVLDRGISSIIFSFAAEEQRRRIIWNSAHR